MTPHSGGAGWEGDHQWKMFGRNSKHSGVADSFERGLSNPGTKWERPGGTTSLGTVIGNFTGNVLATNSSKVWNDQLQCAVYSTVNQVHVVEGTSGDDIWVLNITGTFSAAPVLHDVDQDGTTDILMATRTGVLYAYEPVIRWNGTVFTWWGNNTLREQLWNTTGSSIGTVTASSLVLDDLSGNGSAELVVGSARGVYCLNARYGNELWNRTVSGISISTPAVYKVGTNRNVVATSYNTTPTPNELHMYTIKGNTGALLKHLSMEVSILAAFEPAPPFFPSPVAANLDGEDDGDELIIMQPYVDNTGRIIVFRDGNLDWNNIAYNKSLGGSTNLDHLAHATPVVADLDGDSVLDVVVASWKTYSLPFGANTYTNITVFKGIQGTRGWSENVDETIGLDWELAFSSPVLMDADKDDVLDVLFVQYNGRMNALSGKNGTLLWDYNTQGYPTAFVTTSPAVGDLDLDGFPEVVFNSQAISFLLPDMEITSEDISLTDPRPEEGETVGIDVLVHNEGNEDAQDVLVSVWDGDFLAGNATINTIVAGSSYSARVNYEFYGRVDHTLRAVVDPLSDIEELREDNNEATRDVTIISRYGVALDCPGNESVVDPGTTWHYFCEARNMGEYGNRIKVVNSTAPASWTVRVTPSIFTLQGAGSGSDTMTVDVEVKIPGIAIAGEYPITITATSQNETRNNDSVVLTTVVKGTHGIYLTPTEVRGSVAPGDAIVYKFNATNIGNSVDSFQVEAVIPSPDPAWGVNVFPTQINALGPDQSREISMSVSAPFEASEGEAYTVFLNVESVGDPTRYDESKTVTSVVVPDIAVLSTRYLRADGSEVDGETMRLIVDEGSILVARITNVRRNTDISNLRVRFVVDGANTDVTVQDLPADGIMEVNHTHTFTTIGAHTVEVIADPFEVISDANRGNNEAFGTVNVKDVSPVGSYELTGTVFLADRVTPVPSATVKVTVPSSGYSFTVTSDGLGVYMASLANTRYFDGVKVVLNATDGRDYVEEELLAYSEDEGKTLDLVLSEGVHHNVALIIDSTEVDVSSGESVTLNLTLHSIGNRDATVDITVQAAGWGPTLRDENGSLVNSVEVAVGGSVDLVLAFDVPSGAKGGDKMTFMLLGIPRMSQRQC
jgi:hypothetical protein